MEAYARADGNLAHGMELASLGRGTDATRGIAPMIGAADSPARPRSISLVPLPTPMLSNHPISLSSCLRGQIPPARTPAPKASFLGFRIRRLLPIPGRAERDKLKTCMGVWHRHGIRPEKSRGLTIADFEAHHWPFPRTLCHKIKRNWPVDQVRYADGTCRRHIPESASRQNQTIAASPLTTESLLCLHCSLISFHHRHSGTSFAKFSSSDSLLGIPVDRGFSVFFFTKDFSPPTCRTPVALRHRG
ncbi:hypothetical protein V8C44DRAFT_283012 [Trichoderma aethiopicum]